MVSVTQARCFTDRMLGVMRMPAATATLCCFSSVMRGKSDPARRGREVAASPQLQVDRGNLFTRGPGILKYLTSRSSRILAARAYQPLGGRNL